MEWRREKMSAVEEGDIGCYAVRAGGRGGRGGYSERRRSARRARRML